VAGSVNSRWILVVLQFKFPLSVGKAKVEEVMVTSEFGPAGRYPSGSTAKCGSSNLQKTYGYSP